jgi:ribosomal protein S18 acetylase RimI-like enzyme
MKAEPMGPQGLPGSPGLVDFTSLSGSAEDLAAVRAVLDHAQGYARAVHGGAFGPEEAESVVRDLPPGAPGDAKRVFLIRSGESTVGVIECIVGYPTAGTLMLGMLVIDERRQGLGHGRQAVRWVEQHAREHEGCTRVRLGVVASNASALGFWDAMGYERTGEIRPWAEGTVKSEVIVFEKAIGEVPEGRTKRGGSG